MVTKIILAPAASGKTRTCIERVHSVLQASALAQVWVLLPNRTQVLAFRRGLAETGGALGARVGTFGDLYRTLLAQSGQSIPVMPEPLTYRLALAAIDGVAERGDLEHYAPIRRRPGFIRGFMTLVAEFKRGRIEPPQFASAVKGMGRRLEELALLYAEYQKSLIQLKWADQEGLGWLAVQALKASESLASEWKLVMADGFDSFTLTQIETLRLLSGRVQELVLTLSGEPTMPRKAFRRFERTLDRLRSNLQVELRELPPHPKNIAALAHLEAALFESPITRTDPEGRVSFIEAQTLALEAREALRWIKARIVRDGVRPDQCAVVAYNLFAYRPFLREVGREFGLPLRFADGEPLVNNPAIAAILNLLELSPQNWARRPLLDALRTPYFDLTRFGIAASDTTRYQLVAHWGQIIAGLDQWQEVFTRLEQQPAQVPPDVEEEDAAPPELPTGDNARTLWEHLQQFIARASPPDKATLFVLIEWLEDLLSADAGLAVAEQIAAQTDTALRDQAALAEFRDILRSLVLSERIVGERYEITWSDFLQELRGAVEAAGYVPDDVRSQTEGSIYVASLGAARGVPYRAVALLGLAEGLFPAPLDEDPFLSDEERTTLNAKGLALEPRLRSDQQTIFYEGVTRASEYLLLTRPYLADDGELWEPSPYWNEALALFNITPERTRAEDKRHHTDAGSVVELLTDAVRRRALPKVYAHLEGEWQGLRLAANMLSARIAREPQGSFEGQLDGLTSALETRYSDRHVWSASRIEAYAACPFRFFIRSALQLEPRETPEAGFDPSQLGSMLHSILEQVYQRATNLADVESVVAALPEVARTVFDEAPLQWGFRPTPLWEAQRAELIEKLENTLRELALEANGFHPCGFEVRFGFDNLAPLTIETEIGPVRFHGVIDRVDANDAGEIRVIDYKSGMSHLDARALEDGLRLQLVLYALAAETTLKYGTVIDGFYWGILKGEAGSLRLGRFRCTTEDERELVGVLGAIELTKEYLTQYVRGIRAGYFVPIPPRDDCPHYCDAKTICWRYQPSEI